MQLYIGGYAQGKLAYVQEKLKGQKVPVVNDHYTKFFYDNNLHFNLDMEASTTDQVLAMVQANLGLGFYPEELASEYIMRGEIFPVNLYESAPDRDIVLIRESRHTESIAAKKLINFLKHTTD